MHGHVSVCALKLLVSRCCTRCRLSCQVSRLTCVCRLTYYGVITLPLRGEQEKTQRWLPRQRRYGIHCLAAHRTVLSRGAGRAGFNTGVSRSRLCKVNRTAPDSHTSSREPGALAPSISALCRSISAYKSQAVSLSANRQVTRPSRRLKVSPGTGWRWLRVRRSRSPFFAAPRRTSSPPPGIGSRRPSARTPCCSSRGGGA